MKKDIKCPSTKTHFPTRRVATYIMEKKLKEKELKPGSLHVFRCPECHKFVLGNLRGKEYQILVLPKPEKRIKDLLANPNRTSDENGVLGSLLDTWARENNLPTYPKQNTNRKKRSLNHLIELWNSRK